MVKRQIWETGDFRKQFFVLFLFLHCLELVGVSWLFLLISVTQDILLKNETQHNDKAEYVVLCNKIES